MQKTIDDILTRHRDKLDTRAIVIAHDAIAATPAIVGDLLPDGPWLVCVDDNTLRVAGETLLDALRDAGRTTLRTDVPLLVGEKAPMCDDERVAWFEREIEAHGATAAIAVGAGTINDIVKLASSRREIPMVCVGTAPSMNGFTSGIAAVLSEGVKTTQPCTAPIAVIADLDVMAQAPARMIQSGLGDLLSKPVSNSDWMLSARLIGSHHSREAMAIIEAGSRMLDGVAPRLPSRDHDAVAGLCGSLMLSGLAMSVAGSSSPASGGEHLISHYIDMTAHAFDLPYDFHGCQVGVGTLTTAHIYERFRALDPSTIDIDARVAALLDWEEYEGMLRERFGPLFGAVQKHAQPAYPTPDVLRARLQQLVDEWDVLADEIGVMLRTRQSLEEELSAAGCPTRFRDLDVGRERAREAVVWSKDIRNRYTVLHAAWELGFLDEWADEALELLYE